MSTRPNDESGTSTRTEIDAAGKYHTLMELGRGGSAVVSAGIARGIGGFSKLVVLKKIKEEVLGDRDTVKMFVNEARLSARMSHPNIVQVYEVFRQNKLPVIVMEYLDGQPLARLYARVFDEPAYTIEMAVGILCKVLGGLDYAHNLTDYDGTPLQIVHRDVSPHNVMITYDGQVKLVDFGIAKLSSSSKDTQTGVIKGRIGYMAPEQLDGDSLDRRGDVFALGVMLWEAIARRRMWGGRGDAEIVRCLILDDVPSLRAAVPDVDVELERICKKALATQPDLRYSSAAEFQRELEAFLERRGSTISQQALAELVCRTCADLRATSQANLKTELAKFTVAAPGWDDALEDFESRRTPVPESSSRPRSRDKLRKVLGFALLVAAATATSAVAYTWLAPELSDPPALTSTPSVPPTRVPRTLPPPRRVMLNLSVIPAHADVYLDDRRLSTVPILESLPADTRDHELRVEADGFEPLTRRVRLDSNVELELQLNALAQPPVETARVPPGASGTRSPRQPPPESAAVTPAALPAQGPIDATP